MRDTHVCMIVDVARLSNQLILVSVCIDPCYRRNILKMLGSFLSIFPLLHWMFKALRRAELGLGLKTYLQGRDSLWPVWSEWRNKLEEHCLDLRQKESWRFQSGWEGGKGQLSGSKGCHRPGLAWMSRTGVLAELPSSFCFPHMAEMKKSQVRTQSGQDNVQVECSLPSNPRLVGALVSSPPLQDPPYHLCDFQKCSGQGRQDTLTSCQWNTKGSWLA